ncbi:MAG: hypothetical protein ACI4EL_08525 [Candidatus Fimimorpha sp.]
MSSVPHGGIFVFPVVENVIALVVGFLIAMALLAVFKKSLDKKN